MLAHFAKRLAFLSVGLIVALALSTSAQAKLPQPIYFWGNAAASVSAPGQTPSPRVIRPSLIFLFADGSWDIDHLHWTGWDSSVAYGTGISSASNGIPNETQGKRILTPAQITLSDPGRFQGHEVYRCFVLTDAHIVRKAGHRVESDCLETGGGFSYFGPATPKPPPKQASVEFYAHGIDGGCEMDGTGVGCERYGAAISQAVRLDANGTVRICTQHGDTGRCNLGNFGVIPTFSVGKKVTVGRFRCQVLQAGVQCTVIASGKGFLINSTNVTRIS